MPTVGSLAAAVPAGKTVVVTITAPIRQDSATSALLEERIRKVLATGRSRLEVTLHGISRGLRRSLAQTL